MNKFFKKIGISVLAFSVVLLFVTFYLLSSDSASGCVFNARIHYLTLPSNTEAIVLECTGKFGYGDSGEDTDYPYTGSGFPVTQMFRSRYQRGL